MPRQIEIDAPEREQALQFRNGTLHEMDVQAFFRELKYIDILLSQIILKHERITREFRPEGGHNRVSPARMGSRHQISCQAKLHLLQQLLDTMLALLHLLASAHGAKRTYTHDSSITQVSLVFRFVNN